MYTADIMYTVNIMYTIDITYTVDIVYVKEYNIYITIKLIYLKSVNTKTNTNKLNRNKG